MVSDAVLADNKNSFKHHKPHREVQSKNNDSGTNVENVYNADSHYTLRPIESVAFASVDAQCKVPVGEPGFPIASVLRGKSVIVGTNEVYKVGDHDFSKFSLVPDAILLHDLPTNEQIDDLQDSDDDDE